MSTITIRSSPSGPIIEVLAPPDVLNPDPTKYLSETGEYTVPAGTGAGVSSVQGSDGIAPTSPQTGVVVLSGAALLPLDGSRPMTGDLDMGGNDVINVGTVDGVALQTGGSATNFLNAQGNYVAAPGGASLGTNAVNASNGFGAWVASNWEAKNGLNRFRTFTGDGQINGIGFPAVGDVAAYLRMPAADGAANSVVTTNGAGQLSFTSPQNVATQAGKENYPASVITGGQSIWSGTSGGMGNLYCSIVLMAGTTIPITNMICAVTQTTVALGGLSMAIFNSAGLRLAYTNIVNPVVGFQTVPLAVGSGLQLMSGSQYFFGVYSNRNGDQFGNFLGAGGLPSGLRLGFTVPNSGTVVGALQGIPADVSPYIGNLTTNRFYQLAN